MNVPVEEYEKITNLLFELAEKYEEAVEHLVMAKAVLEDAANCTEECDCDTQVIIAYVKEIEKALLEVNKSNELSNPPNTGGT